jgi:hypothetical protein
MEFPLASSSRTLSRVDSGIFFPIAPFAIATPMLSSVSLIDRIFKRDVSQINGLQTERESAKLVRRISGSKKGKSRGGKANMEQAIAGRTTTGRFTPGHPIKSPGRPKKLKVDYLSLLRDSLNEEESKAIISAAITQAKNGSRHAREWLFKHVLAPLPKSFEVETQREATQEFRDFVDRLSFEELKTFIAIRNRNSDHRSCNEIDPNPTPEAELIALNAAFERQAKEVTQ